MNIGGSISSNSFGIEVGSVTSNKGTGILVDSIISTLGTGISVGSITSRLAGINIFGGISADEYAIKIDAPANSITSGSTGIYIKAKEITSVGTAVQINASITS